MSVHSRSFCECRGTRPCFCEQLPRPSLAARRDFRRFVRPVQVCHPVATDLFFDGSCAGPIYTPTLQATRHSQAGFSFGKEARIPRKLPPPTVAVPLVDAGAGVKLVAAAGAFFVPSLFPSHLPRYCFLTLIVWCPSAILDVPLHLALSGIMRKRAGDQRAEPGTGRRGRRGEHRGGGRSEPPVGHPQEVISQSPSALPLQHLVCAWW